ncbi:Signal recognition particle receptor, alpha subunit [Phaffia rhodozyma]|uniref:Signal recognition particle receptor, alpha subunit n=1 Tax=Phaffia rhodozyma TaxID=264483 RepID=A0A0F7STR8_PHARH|nr:Signal recognition particle receptor, alpha subunit [Phaffia rhodozyma]
MLDYVSISHERVATSSAATPSPINSLLSTVLVEGRTLKPFQAPSGPNYGPGVSKKDGGNVWEMAGWKMEWLRENSLGLIFVLLHSLRTLFLSLHLPFLQSFHASLSAPSSSSTIATTTASTGPTQWALETELAGWESTWEKLVRRVEAKAGASEKVGSGGADKKIGGVGRPKGFSRKSTGATPVKANMVADDSKAGGDAILVQADTPSAPATPQKGSTGEDTEEIARNVEALKNRLKGASAGKRALGKAGANAGTSSPGKSSGESSPRRPATSSSTSKVMRKWGDSAITSADMAALDFSTPPPSSTTLPDGSSVAQPSRADISKLVDQTALGIKRDGLYDVKDLDSTFDEGDDEEDDMISRALAEGSAAAATAASGNGSTSNMSLNGSDSATSGSNLLGQKSLSSFFSRLKGTKVLTKEDLQPVLEVMEKHLMGKNVAKGVCERVCEGVESALIGRKLGSFGSVRSEVRAALSQSITRILTPKSSTDILLEIKRKHSASANAAEAFSNSTSSNSEPYKMVFVGVNGVGKSTNLSKVCFWLLQNELNVLIAACDTFRSGAVEQLRVHVNNLGRLSEQIGEGEKKGRVELFEKGYGKDSATIAKEAISFAKEHAFDVVLIDTAGRMQDNEPLMRALSKLVSVNSPDKIIFVGEALVGNEAVDQLSKFDRSLKEFSAKGGKGKERGIDGMILTKFDTIDDKVGAALSMTYVTGQPILFVGCGQTYTDLRHLRVNHIVQSLLKD